MTKKLATLPPRKRRTGPKPKAQQQTSARAILREKLKGEAIAYRNLNYDIRSITDALNELHGPTGDEPLFRYKPVGRHFIHAILKEAVKEGVDPLEREELKNVAITQMNQVIAAMLGPALQGSVAHAQTFIQAQEKLLRMTGALDTDDPGAASAGAITQVFINGNLANV